MWQRIFWPLYARSMRVLSFGTDKRVLEAGSAARERQEAYAERIGSLDILLFARGRHDPVHTEHLSITPTNSISRWLYGLDALRIARNVPRPDVITAQDPFETGLVALIAAKVLKVPLHIQVHTDLFSPGFRTHSLLNRIRLSLAMFVLRRAARIRVILGRTKDELIARGIAAPITVLPIFVDTARFGAITRVKHPRFKLALLCVGRLEPEKHFELAIDALKAARDAGHDAGLTIVGSGSMMPLLRERARRFGLEQFVDLAGQRDDIAPYLATADIVLVPSRYEGYGLVIIEALAAGVPVLSTDVGVAREAGAIVAPAPEFAQALVRWASSGPRRGELQGYPYDRPEAYIEAYTADIEAAQTRLGA